MSRLLGWMRIGIIDLRGDFRRFVILLACLALGVGAIAAVSSVGAALQSAVQRDARVILGGDMEVRSRGADISPEQRAAVEALGETARVVDITARASANGASTLLSLRAVSSNYPLLGSVAVSPASGEPLGVLLSDESGLPGTVVDQGVLDRLGVTLGDTIRIGDADFAVRGVLEALPDQAALGFQLGLPAVVIDTTLAEAGLQQQGVLSRYGYKVVLAEGNAARAIEGLNAAHPDAGWDLRQPEDAAANLARFFDLFARFLTLVGLSSLLVGGVGVSNAISAYITERRTSIATLRSLGATGARVLVHFLTQVMVLAAAGVLLGLVLGAGTSLVALPVLSGMLGIELAPSLDLRSLVTAAGFGLLIGFAFALLPLRAAQKLKPANLFRASDGGVNTLNWRDLVAWRTSLPLATALLGIAGLAVYTTGSPWLVLWYTIGAGVAFGLLRVAAWLLQALLRLVPPMPNTVLRQAFKSIYRPGSVAPVVVLSLGLGLALLLMITLLDQNLRSQIDGAVAEDAPAFVLLDMPKEQVPLVEAFAAADPGIAALETIPMLRGTIESVKGVAVAELGPVPDDIADMFEGDTALSWARSLPEGSSVVDGEWWADDYSGPPLVSLSTELRAPLGLSVGDSMRIAVAGRAIDVTVANFRDIDWREGGVNFRLLFSPGMVESAPQTVMGAIDVVDGAAPGVEGRLSQAFPTLSFLPVGYAIARVEEILSSLANAVALVGSLAVVSGVLVLAGAMAVGRRQREADAVVMKVLGATRRNVIVAFVVEYGVLGLLAAAMGAGLGVTATWAILTFVMEIPFVPNMMTVAVVIIGAVATTIATGVLTTWSAMSVRPARQLRADGV
ncbi:putative ABC transport system permease protein [Devosia lucknowensis]|uniref:Putative ABC transport system permease protein n=1 Tax=Devosia lucknowensis TaxID=1096929 RepID=A0A1Y6ERB2_9HYPH|nr:FtsX-like permease family protein [Devosia lucknowensis]SMQ65097.1 putative ABC transport system permease protein [Devosia lucknowensis]